MSESHMSQGVRAQSVKIVGSARNASRVLVYLASRDVPARLSDVVGALNINASTCFNILQTLAEDGFVTVRNKAYAPGPELLQLAYTLLERVDDHSRVQMLIDRFAEDHDLSIVLWRIESDKLIALVSASAPSALLEINIRPGRKIPLLQGSVGRVAAAFLPMSFERQRSEFSRAGWTNLSFEEFRSQVANTRRVGYSAERGEVQPGIHAMAAPVPVPSGEIGRAVSVYALASDLPERRVTEIGEALILVAGQIGLERNAGSASHAISRAI